MDYSQYAGKGALPSNQHSEVKWKLLKPRKKLLSSKKKMSMHILRQWSKVYLPIVSLPYFPFHHQIGDGSRELLPPGLMSLTSPPCLLPAMLRFLRNTSEGLTWVRTSCLSPPPPSPAPPQRLGLEMQGGYLKDPLGFLPPSFLNLPDICVFSARINLSLLEQTEPKECK